jgi:D-lactate dehydrogenase
VTIQFKQLISFYLSNDLCDYPDEIGPTDCLGYGRRKNQWNHRKITLTRMDLKNQFQNPQDLKLEYYETHLGPHIINAVEKTDAVCVFVNDRVNAQVIESLAKKGVKVIALRCAGFNNVDLQAAKANGMKVCRVPAYSPEAVAEHAVAMILTLNRKTHKAYNRVREQNFSLNGLLGFDLHNKTV